MNRLEIFQKVYGTNHVFTAQELERLLQVTELIVRECAAIVEEDGSAVLPLTILKHFGVEE